MKPPAPLLVLLLLVSSGLGCSDKGSPTPDDDAVVSDADGDGFDKSQDCDDADALVSPAATERCDGIDNDCDGIVDNDDATDASTWYADNDVDGYGDSDSTTTSCDQPTGYAAMSGDCDDADPDFNPGAIEDDCTDPNDYNCDGSVELEDADGDGQVACEDCNDGEPLAWTGATELCDEVDNDCDGTVDNHDAADASTWYADTDTDGYGDATSTTTACDQPSGYVANTDDCDDGEPLAWTGATELCGDAVDNDCDGGAGACEWTGLIGLGDADAVIEGSSNFFGRVVRGVGDLNGDGLDDIAVGLPYESSYTTNNGGAVLFYGPASGALDDSDADATILSSTYDNAGWYLNSAGDVNADGYGDFIMAGPATTTTWVFLGPVTGDLTTSDADAFLACSINYANYGVTGLGDLDGDGTGEVAVGVPIYTDNRSWQGGTFVIDGPLSGSMVLDTDGVAILGESSTDKSGTDVELAGDVDGDGIDDLIIGVPGDDSEGDDAGAAFVVLGPVTAELSLSSAASEIRGEAAGDEVGEEVDGAGDFDGDGYADLVLGAMKNDNIATGSGAAYIVRGGSYLGSTEYLDSADFRFYGDDYADYVGTSVAGVGDVYDDGLDDVVIGAYNEDDVSGSSGAAFLVLGGASRGSYDLPTDYDAAFTGEANGDRAGYGVGAVGDTNGDGVDDFAVGAYAAGSSGKAYVILDLSGL